MRLRLAAYLSAEPESLPNGRTHSATVRRSRSKMHNHRLQRLTSRVTAVSSRPEHRHRPSSHAALPILVSGICRPGTLQLCSPRKRPCCCPRNRRCYQPRIRNEPKFLRDLDLTQTLLTSESGQK